MSHSSLTPITTPPDPTSIPTLADHQSSTPSTFYAEVLHYHTANAKIALSSDQKFLLPAFFPDATSNDISIDVGEKDENNKVVEEADGDDEEWEDEDAGPMVQDIHLDDVVVMITTKNLTLFSTPLSTGYTIPYPSISLHAITTTPTTSGIYMQINTHTTAFDDHDFSSLEITIYPPQTTVTTSAPASITGSTQEMYTALTECGNLHPDSKSGFFSHGGDGDSEDEGEGGDGIIFLDHAGEEGISFMGGADEVGGIPALAPGGWITAENVDKIQWTIGGESGVGDPNNASLGPGAGNVRRRDEEDEMITSDDRAVDGVETDGMETKWRRTEA